MKPSVKPRHTAKQMTVLDIGTSKVVCFIACQNAAGDMEVTGIGHQLAKGIRSSAITDVNEAETSIVAAVDAAEKMSGTTVDSVMVSLSGNGLKSRNISVEMSLMGEEVSDVDILDIIEQGRHNLESPEQEIIHCIATSYTLDDNRGIVDPRHMFGDVLMADLHIVTAPETMIKNLRHCIGRCHLDVTRFVSAPIAAAHACLEEDEMELGVTLVDIGGGTTSIAVFQHGRCIHTDTIPVGGMHVTSDIAKGVSTSLTHAERLKTLHGSCMPSSTDDQVIVSAPLMGEDLDDEDANTMPRSTLVSIIRPRMEEIFEMVRGRLEVSGIGAQAGRRVVLTGGGSQLIGTRELAARMLSKQIRLGSPKPFDGMAEAATGPSFATAIGMLRSASHHTFEDELLNAATQQTGLLKKIKHAMGWLKESF